PAICINLWEGMGEYPNPCNMVLSDEAGAARMAEMGTKWGTVEGDRILLTDSINCIQDNPAFFIASVIFRVPRAFIVKDVVRNNEIETIKYWEQSGTFLGMNEKISLLFFSIIYDKLYEFIFYGFGLIGLIYLFLRNRFTTLILLSPVLSRAIPFSILHVDPRWIIVGQGVVTIFSALGIYILFKFLLIIIKKNISMN
ncbi:MAG: hypothetical protein IMZ61_03520, partial [Planctomycetes bacterium]|nr:hypothetical protein [Planctomycetota bacterium]